jgi:hypothetical protein
MKYYLKQIICRSVGWALLVGVAGLTGCQSTDQADSGDMASVKVSGHTDAEIKEAAAKVFLGDGYQQVNPLTFEKQGTRWDKMTYGGWSPNPVWIRIRINVTPAEAGQSTLACDAYAVVDRGEGSMEEEKKLSVSYRSECKKILDQTVVRLDSPPGGGAQ